MNFSFNHFNFNVLSIEKSLAFYQKALGLQVARRYIPEDQSFELVYLKDADNHFQLELTEMRGRQEPYDLGEVEFHLAFACSDYTSAHALHTEMGVICFENPGMGIYFIEDPDGYWIEIVPQR